MGVSYLDNMAIRRHVSLLTTCLETKNTDLLCLDRDCWLHAPPLVRLSGISAIRDYLTSNLRNGYDWHVIKTSVDTSAVCLVCKVKQFRSGTLTVRLCANISEEVITGIQLHAEAGSERVKSLLDSGDQDSKTSLRILMYHRFSGDRSQAYLEAQCRHLAAQYETVTLSQGMAGLAQNEDKAGRRMVAVTVDDGYRDFVENAFPIFAAYNIPVIVFLPTDFIDGLSWCWWDMIDWSIKHTHLVKVRIPLSRHRTVDIVLNGPGQQLSAITSLTELAKKLLNDERLELIQKLPNLLEVDLPLQVPSEFAPLTWDNVRTLVTQGVQFGTHTKSHPILSSIDDRQLLLEEIVGSKQRIEAEVECSVEDLCYPNGTLRDINATVSELVQSWGFMTGLTAIPGVNMPGVDPLRLKRIRTDPEQAPLLFRSVIDDGE